MSRRFMQVCLAGALLASASVGAASASASWTTNGNATGTPITYFNEAGVAIGGDAGGGGGSAGGIFSTQGTAVGRLFGSSAAATFTAATVTSLTFNGTCTV